MPLPSQYSTTTTNALKSPRISVYQSERVTTGFVSSKHVISIPSDVSCGDCSIELAGYVAACKDVGAQVELLIACVTTAIGVDSPCVPCICNVLDLNNIKCPTTTTTLLPPRRMWGRWDYIITDWPPFQFLCTPLVVVCTFYWNYYYYSNFLA